MAAENVSETEIFERLGSEEWMFIMSESKEECLLCIMYTYAMYWNLERTPLMFKIKFQNA